MNITEHIDREQIHVNLPQMPIEDVLDRMLTSCRSRFRVPDVQWPGVLREVSDDYIQMERGSSGAFDTGGALLNPFSKRVATLEQWTFSVAVFPAGTRWNFCDEPHIDRAQGAPIRLVVLILPTNPTEFLKVLHYLSRLFKLDTVRRLSCSENPKEILRMISSALSSAREGI